MKLRHIRKRAVAKVAYALSIRTYEVTIEVPVDWLVDELVGVYSHMHNEPMTHVQREMAEFCFERMRRTTVISL